MYWRWLLAKQTIEEIPAPIALSLLSTAMTFLLLFFFRDIGKPALFLAPEGGLALALCAYPLLKMVHD